MVTFDGCVMGAGGGVMVEGITGNAEESSSFPSSQRAFKHFLLPPFEIDLKLEGKRTEKCNVFY